MFEFNLTIVLFRAVNHKFLSNRELKVLEIDNGIVLPAKFIEKQFGGKPQDIEGGIIFRQNSDTGEMEPEIHIWQTRDVHLIKR